MSPPPDGAGAPRPPRRITPFDTPQYTAGKFFFPVTDAMLVALVQSALDKVKPGVFVRLEIPTES